MKNYLVVIPARGGSKGLPNKNIKKLNGKPLVYYTIEAAREVFADNLIILSTDSNKIKKIAEKTGLKVPFLRPNNLSYDISSQRSVLIHAINYYEKKNKISVDAIILLQPTSPLRTSLHIKEAIKLYSNNLDMIVSVKETKMNPFYVLFTEDENNYLNKIKSGNFATRQECPKVWELNGAIYIINKNSIFKKEMSEFLKVKKYVMNSNSSIDIDNILDFNNAEFVLKNQ